MKDDRIYLEHIQNSVKKVLEYVEGMALDTFRSDSKTQDACVRQLEIVGEATKRLSMPLRDRFGNVPWKDMAGMRDRLIHQYIDVDLMIVWLTITEDATPILINIEAILDTLEREKSSQQ